MKLIKEVFAQDGKIYNPLLKDTPIGRGGTEGATQTIGILITNILNAMLMAGAIMLLIMIVWSGISWITSGADKERLQTAQRRLTNAIIGFIILICVFAIANFIGSIFGLGWFKNLEIPFPTAGTV
jgi:cytochrome bd-type quinol oxidase subunit 2